MAQTITQAADLRAIKRLEHRQAQYLSAGRWQDAAALFSDSAVLIAGEARIDGRGAIADWLRASSQALPEQGLPDGRLHEVIVLSPVLNLSTTPGEALGRWRRLELSGEHGGVARWAVGINENHYVKQDGQWRFAQWHHYPLFAGDYAAGWRNLKQETEDSVTPVPFHYTVDEAGVPAPAQTPAATVDDASALVTTLEHDATRLLDEDAIVNLQNAYGYYLDRHLWDNLTDLFHPEGSLAIGASGVYQGKDSIRAALEQFGPAPLPAGVVFDHLQLQPVVSISADGKHATARGTELQMLGRHAGESLLGIAIHTNAYRKVDGRWLLDQVRVHTRMLSDYQQGWAADARPAPPLPGQDKADQPREVRYAPYPMFAVPGFPAPARYQSAADTGTATGSLEQRLTALATQARRLEAYQGIENIANAYGYAIDEFLWDDMADLFALNGWKELSYIGRYTGRERVRQSVVDRYGRGGRRANSMTFHQKTQPVISVSADGNTASIRTRLFQMNSSLQNPGSWMSGIYENTAVRENGIWKLGSMDLDYTWSANYQGGWTEVAPNAFDRFVPDPASLTGAAAPDAPLRGRVTPPYPADTVDMAFHYRNPVSDREPPLLLEVVPVTAPE